MGKGFGERKYPVVHPAPGTWFTVKNFAFKDYFAIVGFTLLPTPFAYSIGFPYRMQTMYTSAALGGLAGYIFAYQNSCKRLMGYTENKRYVEKYGEWDGPLGC
mmetsp:Transcript_5464/g.15404  ORF Transcript_5464/g.15404 Transcript_5464/m.15404 type:complete len:103 (+) Transcript_5464:97-405(+)